MLIGICGGIGSGKSVVSRILRLRGLPVYDCDLEAKRLMDESEEVLESLNSRFGDDVCPAGGPINRPELARHVFGNDGHRMWLNSLVHRLVREDVTAWHAALEDAGEKVCFVESAIPASSGLGDMCGEVWVVTAPEEERITRVAGRDGLDADAVRSRINSQRHEETLLRKAGIPLRFIRNSSADALLSQLPC